MEAAAAPAPAAEAVAQHDPEAAEVANLAAIKSPLWAKFQQRVSTIKDHPIFRDIMTAKPPEILGAGQSGSGSQDPFDADKCKVALEKTNTYKCAQNFFMHNLMVTATPSVPIRASSIADLKKFFFNDGPASYPMPLEVAVCGGPRTYEHAHAGRPINKYTDLRANMQTDSHTYANPSTCPSIGPTTRHLHAHWPCISFVQYTCNTHIHIEIRTSRPSMQSASASLYCVSVVVTPRRVSRQRSPRMHQDIA